MKLFRKQKPTVPAYPPEQYTPVLRCSICTGEEVACFREKESGRLREIMLIRSSADLERFCRDYGVKAEEIKKIY